MSIGLQSKGSIWVIFCLAAGGAALGVLLAISETAVRIHADREGASDYQLEVKVLGMGVDRQVIRSTEELRPQMFAWGHGLTAAFALVGAFLGASIGVLGLIISKRAHGSKEVFRS